MVEIRCRYSYTYHVCREFEIPITEAIVPNFMVEASERCILQEYYWNQRLQKIQDKSKKQLKDLSEDIAGYYEGECIFGEICQKMPYYNAFLMHAAVVAVDGVAYMFAAPSGTGKTTHMRLWMDLLGDRAQVVNGDKPLIRIEKGVVYACSTPWRGKEGLGANDLMLPVGGACVIEQNPENHIRKLSMEEASRYILNSNEIHLSRDNQENFDRFWNLFCQMMNKIDFYLLQCNREPAAAQLSYETMRRRQDAENQKGLSAAQIGR